MRLISRDLIESNQGQLPPILTDPSEQDFTESFSRDQRLVADIFWGAAEIWESLDALKDIETYMSRFPYSRLGISKSRYLVYHIGNYLNEVYVLKERVVTFCDKLAKKYRKNSTSDLAAIESARKAALEALEVAVEARGTHIHDQRFNDPMLHRLAGLEIVIKQTDDERHRVFATDRAKRLYREQRDRWRRTIRDTNDQAERTIDDFFTALHPLILTDQGEVRRPRNWPDV